MLKRSGVRYDDVLAHGLNEEILALDGGSGIARLCDLIRDERQGHGNRIAESSLQNYSDSLSLDEFSTGRSGGLGLLNVGGSPIQIASHLTSLVRSHLLTHTHLDHVAALAINSPAHGISSGKTVYALPSTCDILEDHIFNDRVWPNLIDKGAFLAIHRIAHAVPSKLNSCYTVTPFTVNHGCISPTEPYHSTAFLIEHNHTKRALLIFGDLEADMSSSDTNAVVWNAVAPFIAAGTLYTIMIECSTSNVPAAHPLYGHMTPDTLLAEIINFDCILKRHEHASGVQGLHFLITHIKEQPSLIDPRKVILHQLNELKSQHALDVRFTILLPGQTYTVD